MHRNEKSTCICVYVVSSPASIVSHLSSFTIHLNRSSRNLFSPSGSRDRSQPFLGDTCKRPVLVPIRAKQADHLKLQRVSETDLFRRPFSFYYTLNSPSIVYKLETDLSSLIAYDFQKWTRNNRYNYRHFGIKNALLFRSNNRVIVFEKS